MADVIQVLLSGVAPQFFSQRQQADVLNRLRYGVANVPGMDHEGVPWLDIRKIKKRTTAEGWEVVSNAQPEGLRTL
jgi:hypothetical protein